MRLLGDRVELKPEGYAVDRNFPDIVYVPEDAEFDVREGRIRAGRTADGERAA